MAFDLEFERQLEAVFGPPPEPGEKTPRSLQDDSGCTTTRWKFFECPLLIFPGEFGASGGRMKRVILDWLAGRKTYLVAAGVFLGVLGLVFFGRLTPQLATTVVVLAVPAFAATFRSALARHQQQELVILQAIAAAGRAAALHNDVALVNSLRSAVQGSVELAQQVAQENTQAASQHQSGVTAG